MRKLLFFHAPWCAPCRNVEKTIITPLEERIGTDKIERINAQNEPFKADNYKVSKLPTVIVLDGENEFYRGEGRVLSADILEKYFDKN